MIESGTRPVRGSVVPLGIADGHAHWNLTAQQLQDIAVKSELATITNTGALAIDTGTFTGRSPKDKFTVRDAITEKSVWWSTFNIPFDSAKFEKLYQKMIAYLNGKEFYVRDVYACADPRYRMNVRVITELAWSNLFVHNMFLRPTE